MVTAIILAGGLGTRLAQVVPHFPKALAPIQGIPFLQLLLQQLENSLLVSKIVLALGYQAASIQNFAQSNPCSIPLEFSIEPHPLGTGGALLYALNKTNGETLLVLNGDTYFDLPFSSFLRSHQRNKADITLACREVQNTSRYGSVIMDSSFKVVSFREKTAISQPGWINGGIYLIQKSLLLSFSPGVHSIENDFFPLFLEKNLFAFPHNGSFIDIGTPNSYNEAQEILKPLCKSGFPQ